MLEAGRELVMIEKMMSNTKKLGTNYVPSMDEKYGIKIIWSRSFVLVEVHESKKNLEYVTLSLTSRACVSCAI